MDERLVVDYGSKPDDSSDFKIRVYEESRKIWKSAFPAMLSRTSQFGMIVVTQAFIGHIGPLELAAYALMQLVIVRFANGILLGMSSATETLCGQAFGAKQYHIMGIYLQRSIIINFITATLLCPIFIFSTQIFKLLGEDSQLANNAGVLSVWFIPILYSFVFSFTMQNFLQGQLKNMVIAWLSVFSFLLHLVLSWIFVSKLDLGISGAMGSMILSSYVVVIGEFVYIFGGWCDQTWKGFTWVAFVDLLPVLKLSLSSGLMLCLELWYNAILILLAGYMKNATVAISAFSICINIISWEFMLCIGFLVASSVRVSNELGRGNAEAVKFSIKVTLSTSLSICVLFSALCLIFGHKIGYLFTNDMEVAETVSDLSVLLSFSVLLSSVQTVFSGVAVGAGWQSTVAFVNIGCYYFIGIPLGLLLGYVAKLEVKGMWIGMVIGILMQSLVLGYITWKTDWDEEVIKASTRVNKWLLKPESNDNSSEEERYLLQ